MAKLKYAPILISVYDREIHLKKCIESLQKCKESKDSIIVITSDYPKSKMLLDKINTIRDYILTIKGFKKVIPIFFEKNVGCDFAHEFGRKKIFEISNEFISMEDDIVVSPHFLTYMNYGLSFYKDDPKVFSICGFSPYILTKNYSKFNIELVSSNRWNAWGFGSWKNKFQQHLKFRYDTSLIKNLENENNKGELKLISDKLSRNYYPHFLYCIKENKLPAFDHLVSLYCLKNNLVNIYCQSTFTKNYGHDGSGLHSAKDFKITTHMLNDFSQQPPKFISSEKLMFTNDLPFINENIIISQIKVFLIWIGAFKLLKKYFRLIFK